MKNTILLLACLCCAALCINAIAAQAATPQLTTLRGDSGKNYSDINFTLFSSLVEYGSLNVGEAVKFTAPKSGWKLQKVRILGWSGYNQTTQSYPADRNIMVEIRDKDLNLLYKFVDSQNNYFLSDVGPRFGEIEIPAVPLTGDFYVVYYDRGAAPVGTETADATGKSYIFINGEMEPAEFPISENNETVTVNWLMEAAGK
ncbi:MAG: hypothetical protein A4E49_01449 [Methanosaeta sp. PtaU1.Bin112]|nr:MAG: hypothetical protein A4E49_01449 [Methanosaeta sp. PtaU1.Bin112]